MNSAQVPDVAAYVGENVVDVAMSPFMIEKTAGH